MRGENVEGMAVTYFFPFEGPAGVGVTSASSSSDASASSRLGVETYQ